VFLWDLGPSSLACLGYVLIPSNSKKIFFRFEQGFCNVAQVGLKLVGSSSPPTLASQMPGTIGMYHRACWHILPSDFVGFLCVTVSMTLLNLLAKKEVCTQFCTEK
jgi:hypothetical protein